MLCLNSVCLVNWKDGSKLEVVVCVKCTNRHQTASSFLDGSRCAATLVIANSFAALGQNWMYCSKFRLKLPGLLPVPTDQSVYLCSFWHDSRSVICAKGVDLMLLELLLSCSCREASRAGDEQQSLQAEAEVAVRTARRAACRLKARCSISMLFLLLPASLKHHMFSLP